MLEKISKETIILVFAAFFIGILLGKSLTPVILKHCFKESEFPKMGYSVKSWLVCIVQSLIFRGFLPY